MSPLTIIIPIVTAGVGFWAGMKTRDRVEEIADDLRDKIWKEEEEMDGGDGAAGEEPDDAPGLEDWTD